MNISLTWLSDFLNWNDGYNWQADLQAAEAIAERITTGTAEVDEVEVQGTYLDKCCVGKIIAVSKHPNADKLSLCTVQTDDGEKPVVCGGTNLREGMRVAFAHIGARVKWHGDDEMTLSKCKIRGELSEGMICAAEELGLEELFPESVERIIVDLGDGNENVGDPLKDYLGLTDVVLHVDNHAITQRPDLFSHVGFARECVALGLASWKQKPEYRAPAFADAAIPFKTINEIPDLIPRYCSCLLEFDEPGETPDWMKKRLEATGWRSLNLPVDITNFVAMEVGMPLHSFDADDFKGDIVMRTTEAGEKITTLDEVQRELPEGAIVISDNAGIFDLLGIMGGLRSSTKDSTRRIYLHSAIVDPVSIRRAIIATGHRTDASTTYEKGVPRITAEQGFYRALQLMLELIPGARIVSTMENQGDDGGHSPVTITEAYVGKKLGVDIPHSRIVQILEALECSVDVKGDDIVIAPPLFRRDMNGPHDMIEEIGRIYGYNDIPDVLPEADTTPPARDHRRDTMRDTLQQQGFYELLPLSLVGPTLLEKAAENPEEAPLILNAIGEEHSRMHTSVLPSLLVHAQENLRKTEGVLKTFHIGKVFHTKREEFFQLGMLYTVDQGTGLNDDPFLLLKRDLLSALSSVDITVDVQKADTVPAAGHPGRCADIVISGTVYGQIFEVHPSVRATFDLEHRSVAVLLNLSLLLELLHADRVYKALPQFPAVSYDVTIPASHQGDASALLAKARETSDLLESIEIVDVYQPQAGTDYSLTLRATYRAADRTLKEAEAQKEHEKVVGVLQ